MFSSLTDTRQKRMPLFYKVLNGNRMNTSREFVSLKWLIVWPNSSAGSWRSCGAGVLIFPDAGEATDTIAQAQLPVILTVAVHCALPHTAHTLHTVQKRLQISSQAQLPVILTVAVHCTLPHTAHTLHTQYRRGYRYHCTGTASCHSNSGSLRALPHTAHTLHTVQERLQIPSHRHSFLSF